jgi:beta-1,4-mannosyltransferase
MYGYLRGATPYEGRAVVEAMAGVRALHRIGTPSPVVLGYWPAARTNPYQALLYQQAWQQGFAPVALSTPQDFAQLLEGCEDHVTPVLHLHWTLEVLRGIDDVMEARAQMARFLALLDAFTAAGGLIVWTVHNVLPHDCTFPDLESALQREIVERAHVVHVLTRSTSEAVADQFTIPASKVLHVPHPHYIGSYADTLTREQARFDIGVEPDQIVYSMLGAIKPYKGLEDLLDAFDVLAAREPGRRCLVVAGLPDADGSVDDLLVRCESHPDVRLRAERVPDVDMQRYLKAADIAVLPYRRSLNSGVLLLSMSFGVPVVVPDLGSTSEIVDDRFARTFDPSRPGDLLRALEEADALVTTASARTDARQKALEFDPSDLSRTFFTQVRSRLGI